MEATAEKFDIQTHMGTFRKKTDLYSETSKAKELLQTQGQIAHIWSWEDIIMYAYEQMKGIVYNREEAEEILRTIERRIDSELGVTWITLDCNIDDYDCDRLDSWLDDARESWIVAMGLLILDERESIPLFDDFVKEKLYYLPTEENNESLEDHDYKYYLEFKELADRASEEAGNVAYKNRVAQSREELGKAQDDYEQALDACRAY